MNYTLQQKTFLVLLTVVSIGFGWILLPFSGAVFWSVVLAILFAPLYRWLLLKTRQKRNAAALLTLLSILVMVILPMALVGASLVREGTAFYVKISSGQLNFGAMFQQIVQVLPQWLINLLERLDLTDLASLQQKLANGAAQVSQAVARQAVNIGRNTFEFVISAVLMLYMLFFFLRDGQALAAQIRQAIPLSQKYKQRLFNNFTTVIRATVKGNVVVAIVQGALGGLIFWFLDISQPLLWGVLMAFLSLLPAVGAAIIWAPVAIYLLVTNAIWQGITLTVFCVVVIGLIDNILRPILVGKDTKMPDYMVLLSTLGGISLVGLNGFVIGPVIAALFLASWDLFAAAEEFHPE